MSRSATGRRADPRSRRTRPRPRSPRTPYLLLLPAGLWLLVFFAAPVVSQASTSVQSGSVAEGYRVTGDLSHYAEALTVYGGHFLRSFAYAGAATLGALLIGYPLAHTLAFRAGRWRVPLLALVVAPFLTSFLLRTLAWKTILSDGGPLVETLSALRVLEVTAALGLTGEDRILASPLAVICGLVYNFLPFMVLPLYAALERVDPALREAARDAYATPAAAFRTVTLPLSLPGVAAGSLLTFIPASGDYINAQLLGSPGEQMIGNAIQKRFLNVLDYPTAAAMSFLLMAAVLLLLCLRPRGAVRPRGAAPRGTH
ncbi:ABC transporter permease [Streptomyces sp. AJS327]|uniref:ABC transporter permease n=1 Tax=Streptomyces sp. AJS327 TaxID=2545265 RepID=UPI0015DFDCB9|nr:ABC transporter permease [Streptomyces sp. AJS327]MBA0051843.1 ABC transporter permease [Streptomyces sp. AJS327]